MGGFIKGMAVGLASFALGFVVLSVVLEPELAPQMPEVEAEGAAGGPTDRPTQAPPLQDAGPIDGEGGDPAAAGTAEDASPAQTGEPAQTIDEVASTGQASIIPEDADAEAPEETAPLLELPESFATADALADAPVVVPDTPEDTATPGAEAVQADGDVVATVEEADASEREVGAVELSEADQTQTGQTAAGPTAAEQPTTEPTAPEQTATEPTVTEQTVTEQTVTEPVATEPVAPEQATQEQPTQEATETALPQTQQTGLAMPDQPDAAAGEDAPPVAEGETAPPAAPAPVLRAVPVSPGLDRAVEGVTVGRLPSIAPADNGPAPAPESEQSVTTPEPDAADETLPARQRYAASFEPVPGPLFSVILLDDPANPAAEAAITALPMPVAVALDPHDPDAPRRAQAYRAAGHEIVILAAGLPERATPADLEVTFDAWLRALPEAVALLDPAEDGFQANRSLAQAVMPFLAADGHGLITHERGLNPAQQSANSARVANTSVFRSIDSDDENQFTIRRYLDRATFRAQQEGWVVVLGRAAHPDTIDGLIGWRMEGRAGQVAIVPVSAVLRLP